MPDSAIPDVVKADAVKTKGYFIYPSQLFVNVAAKGNSNESLNTDLAATFKATLLKKTSRACSLTLIPPATDWAIR